MKDDFYVALTRKARNGATLVVYLNVEYYNGPGSYDWAQMLVAVYSETTIYRWTNDNVHVTVGPGEASVTLPVTKLEWEPILINCTQLIAPARNNQLQEWSLPRVTCGGRGAGGAEIGGTAETISGALQCSGR
jgi:hypothetical protein